MKAARRLGLVDSDQDGLEAVRASLEHLVPKARGPMFSDIISDVACDMDEEESLSLKADSSPRTSRAKPR